MPGTRTGIVNGDGAEVRNVTLRNPAGAAEAKWCGEVRVLDLLGFDAAASSGETVGTGRSSSVTTGWRRPPLSAFAQVSGSFAQWAHQAIDAKPT